MSEWNHHEQELHRYRGVPGRDDLIENQFWICGVLEVIAHKRIVKGPPKYDSLEDYKQD